MPWFFPSGSCLNAPLRRNVFLLNRIFQNRRTAAWRDALPRASPGLVKLANSIKTICPHACLLNLLLLKRASGQDAQAWMTFLARVCLAATSIYSKASRVQARPLLHF